MNCVINNRLYGVVEMAAVAQDLRAYIEGIPKAELHIHIEGTFEPELMQKIAKRNGLPFEGTPESHRKMREHFKVSGRVRRAGVVFPAPFNVDAA